MELKCLHTYSCPDFTLKAGDTTIDKDISVDKKNQMLADYPTWFEETTADVQNTEASDEAPVTAAEETTDEAPVTVKPGKKPVAGKASV